MTKPPTAKPRTAKPPTANPATANGPGFFINLDRTTRRRIAMERGLAASGLGGRYRRFAAIDGSQIKAARYAVSPGEAGCFLSHLAVLEAGARTGKHFHVLEDDAIFSPAMATCLEMILTSLIA
jgi:GR25 family glycosyltransferase involved in LPS biosynthesis